MANIKAMAKRITTKITMDSPNAKAKVTGNVPMSPLHKKRGSVTPKAPFKKR